MNDWTLSSASLHFVRVTHKTCWTFVRLHTGDGRLGEGEATLTGREDALVAAAERLVPLALADGSEHPGGFAGRHPPASIQESAIVSAIDQALWSLNAQANGHSLAQTLGVRRDRMPVYANINRRTEKRNPEGFAASARAAMEAGHVAFKVAPFDEVTPEVCAQGDGVRAMQDGLARIAAVREAVGSQARLMVDCHWRFDEASAGALNEAAARLGVHWIETPLPESESNIPALVRLCRSRNERRLGDHAPLLRGWRVRCGDARCEVHRRDSRNGAYGSGVRIAWRSGLATQPERSDLPRGELAGLGGDRGFRHPRIAIRRKPVVRFARGHTVRGNQGWPRTTAIRVGLGRGFGRHRSSEPRRSVAARVAVLGSSEAWVMRLGNEFLHRVLTAQGIPHEYRLVPGEGHFPVAPERFLATFAFIGRALGHGGGDSQADP
ncbi:MAG: hypothetical protein OXG44_09265 [Gammaproteobacteria bacterium]|nr:hypothetical protein [Gammaproteobacteria bacterium]